MRYSVKVSIGDALWAYSIEAANQNSAMIAAVGMHTHPVRSVAMLTEPLLVHEDGRVVMNGDHLTSGKGDEWRFDGKELPRHAGSTGRVLVSRLCTGCESANHPRDPFAPEGHAYWCKGREERQFFPNVFDLRWVMPSASE